jgi:hypothetical protein
MQGPASVDGSREFAKATADLATVLGSRGRAIQAPNEAQLSLHAQNVGHGGERTSAATVLLSQMV